VYQVGIADYEITTTIFATLRYTMSHTIQMFLMVSLGIFSSPFIVVIAPQVLCSVHIFQLPVAAAAVVWISIYYHYHYLYHLLSFTLFL
jgi:hypothetical protein